MSFKYSNREKFLQFKDFFLEVSQSDNRSVIESADEASLAVLALYIKQIFLGRVPVEKASFKKVKGLKSYTYLESSFLNNSLSNKHQQKDIFLKSRKVLPILLEALW